MKNVKIYQTNNRDYVFMNWEWSEKYFDMKDYEKVFEGNLEVYDCEEVFEKGNDGTLKRYNPYMRSISVSDVIELDGVKYFVDGWGFKEVD